MNYIDYDEKSTLSTWLTKKECGDGATYNVLGYVFRYLLCIWRQIRGYLEDLFMVEEHFVLFSFKSL